ncbi:MAG: erythromycin esterase family protein [Deltaproteobacteria bacterium]|nr:erythromycin esterase family protein [Deltaproteobacteria bacterium]
MRSVSVSISIAVGFLACGQPSTPPVARLSSPVTPALVVPDARPPDDPYRVALNLDFEQVADGWATGWADANGGTTGVAVALDHDAHGGATSLRVHDPAGTFAGAGRGLDAIALRGKRVRLHAWIKTDGVTAPGWAGLWLRVDGGATHVFDNMVGRGLTGTEAWREASVSVDVPADGVGLVLGPLVVGGGTAWFDDLRLEVTDVPPPRPVELGGVVIDPAGAPVAGAVVALTPASGRVAQITTTGSSGRFAFHAVSGVWSLSAQHATGDGAFVDPRELTEDNSELRLALEASGGVRVRGRVIAAAPLPPGTYAQVGPISGHGGDVFAIPIGADGQFTARLPRGDQYSASIIGADLRGDAVGTRIGDEVAIELRITQLGPPPAVVTAWVAANAARLDSAEAGHGQADLAPIGAMVGKAHLVGLGEATHGTREFFQLKHRILEYLVARHGFSVFAIEANLPECRAINDYVLRGKGDPKAALDGIYFWTWNTEEVLAMIEWMRAWNADPKHVRKVQFAGFDMQTTKVAYANVRAFLTRVAPADVDALVTPLAVLGGEREDAWSAVPAADRTAIVARLAELARRFDRSAAAWSRAAGKDAFLDARQDLRVLDQAVTMMQSGSSDDARDRAMAENIDALLRRQPTGTRVVLWAHNAHVSITSDGVHSMGSRLRQTHGKDYTVFGFAFGQGSFQAIDVTSGTSAGLQEQTLGPPPASDVSAPFAATGLPMLAIDLRRAPKGPVADWLAAPRPMRETGAVFASEATMSQMEAIAQRFDALIYVDHTTRARPNPGGLRPAPKHDAGATDR